MLKKIANNLHWLPSYAQWYFHARRHSVSTSRLSHLFFAICDHYEPYWNNADPVTARGRIKRWVNEYPKVAQSAKDSDGRSFVYSFFYPEEEYRYEDMEQIADICRAGLGEVEVHLHHDNDHSENLRTTLLDFKKRLANDHGLLSRDSLNGDISYAFIHGNWALDNSRPDGKYCGINNELTILQETGCFADLTMPSAPDITQTREVNRIYFAVDDPARPKSHDSGEHVAVGKKQNGLLMIQGPLVVSLARCGIGFCPNIENGGLFASNPPSMQRIQRWADCRIHVSGAPEWVFVKVYTHGTQEAVMRMFFDDGLLAELVKDLGHWTTMHGCALHFVSAREMANIIFALQDGVRDYDPALRDYRFRKIERQDVAVTLAGF